MNGNESTYLRRWQKNLCMHVHGWVKFGEQTVWSMIFEKYDHNMVMKNTVILK